ncbi:MAG: hypothetical protein ACI9CD_001094 [Candidatus Deianiraeaceae bacterium]|jgi:hypothetical protein
MQYIALAIAFLFESTINPSYINISFNVDFLIIVYFLIITKTKKVIFVFIPATLIAISDFITASTIGMNSILIILMSSLYYGILVQPTHSFQERIYKKKTRTVYYTTLLFATLLLTASASKILILKLLGYNITLTSEALQYFINIIVFFTLSLCMASQQSSR